MILLIKLIWVLKSEAFFLNGAFLPYYAKLIDDLNENVQM